MSNERYELKAKEPALSAARLLYIARSKYDAGWHSNLHAHTHAEIFYCVQGAGSLSIGPDEKIALEKDDLVLINPGVVHTEYSIGHPLLEYIVLGVENIEFSSRENPSMRFNVVPLKQQRQEFIFLHEDMLREMMHGDGECETVCQLELQVLLRKIARLASCDIMPRDRATGIPECEEVRRYIDDNYFEALDLEKLAKHTHINKFYLAHQFQKEMGISPIRYLSERRIKEAKYFLHNTDHSLAQISEMVGFSSLSYFSQSFRRSVGLSPSEYRAAVKHIK